MTKTPDQEREEIRDGLRVAMERSIAVMRNASLYVARGEAIPFSVINDLIFARSIENELLTRKAAVDGTSPPATVVPITTVPLEIIQARLEAEGAWDTYVTYMFGAPARRNAFLKTMFIGRALAASDAATRNSMLNSGLTQAQVDRIMAV